MTAAFLLHDVGTVRARRDDPRSCRRRRRRPNSLPLGEGARRDGDRRDVERGQGRGGEACGCDYVAVTSREDFARSVLTVTSRRGVDVVFDAVGKDTFERSVECLAPRGRLVSFGQASGDVGAQSIDQLASRSVTVSRPNYVHYTDTPDKMALQSGRLFDALRSGAVIAERPRRYPLAEAARAHADLEGRRTTRSLILIA